MQTLPTQRSANGCYKEAADIAGTLGQYPRAIELFERVASQSLGSALTRYGVKEYYLKAGLCWLATGVSCLSSYLICRVPSQTDVAAVFTHRTSSRPSARSTATATPTRLGPRSASASS